MEEDTRKTNLKIQHLRDIILRDINDAHLEVGAVFLILKDIIRDVENIYTEQVQKEYKEFCDEANADADKTNEESSSEDEEGVTANINEEGAK